MKIVTQLEHDQLTPSRLMAHGPPPRRTGSPYQAHRIDEAPGGLLPGVAKVSDGLVAMMVGNGMMIEARYQ